MAQDVNEIEVVGARAEQMARFLQDNGALLLDISPPKDGEGLPRYIFIEDDAFRKALALFQIEMRRGFYS